MYNATQQATKTTLDEGSGAPGSSDTELVSATLWSARNAAGVAVVPYNTLLCFASLAGKEGVKYYKLLGYTAKTCFPGIPKFEIKGSAPSVIAKPLSYTPFIVCRLRERAGSTMVGRDERFLCSSRFATYVCTIRRGAQSHTQNCPTYAMCCCSML